VQQITLLPQKKVCRRFRRRKKTGPKPRFTLDSAAD
jgi:hypothetical protein